MSEYNYFAFISYCSQDEKWAKWLHSHLEGYNIPNAVRKGTSIPKNIRPIFWYKTDLSGTKLHNALENELRSSKYLILVASPESAKSVWVNAEVQSFINSGREDHIIPFIVSGQQDNADQKDYCYPDALKNLPKENELRGIDVHKCGKAHALIDIIATMLGLRFDVLWQRQKRKQIRNRIIKSLVTLLALLFCLFLWDYNREISTYYTDYVDTYGVPEGICKLSNEQFRHRKHSYKFVYRRIPLGQPDAYSWRLYSVAYINSKEVLQEVQGVGGERFSYQIYNYNKDTGKLSYIENYNHNNILQCKYMYSPREGVDACIVDIESAGKDRQLGFSTISSSSWSSEEDRSSNITRFIFERDSLGRIIRKTFHSNNDYIFDRSITSDFDGVFGHAYKLDSIGRIVQLQYLDKELNMLSIGTGFSQILFEYDQFSNHCSCSYLDMNGNAVAGRNKWAKYKDVCDIYGNAIEETTYDPDGNLYLFEGACKRVWIYDESGFQTESRFYGEDNELCLNDYQFAISKSKFDKFGNEIQKDFYDTKGNLVMAYDEYASWKAMYDENGNETYTAYFDDNGEPCITNEGFSSTKSVYDDNHNCIEVEFFGVDGNRCIASGLCSKIHYSFNDKNQIVEERFYGITDSLCLKEGGLAIVRYEYDERGNKVLEQYFGTDEQPIECVTGYHKKVSTFNDLGLVNRTVFYNKHQKRCNFYRGFCERVYDYDNKGNNTKISYFDSKGDPCLNDENYHQIVREFNDKGFHIKSQYYDTQQNPVLINNVYHIRINEYDDRGNIISIAYYNTKEQPCAGPDGYSKKNSVFDSHNLVIKESFYDSNNLLCEYKDKYAVIEYKYDNKYNRIESRMYNKNNQPGNSLGVFIEKTKYDNRSMAVEYTYYNNVNKPCPDEEGVFKYKTIYNEKKELISCYYYDKNGKLVLNKSGFAGYKSKFDSRGNEIECQFLGLDLAPKNIDDNYAIYRYKYDKYDHVIEASYFDSDFKPVNTKDGYCRIVYTYFDFYTKVNSKYYDNRKKLVKEENEDL